MTDRKLEETKALIPRDEKGHFLPGVYKPGMIRSSEQGLALRERRKQLAAEEEERRRTLALLAGPHARKALVRAISEAVGEEVKSAPEAIGRMAGMAAESYAANIMDKPREATEAGKLAARWSGFGSSADEKQAAMPASGAALLLSDAAARGLTDALARLIERRTDEG